MLFGDDGWVGDDIVDAIGAHRGRIAQEIDLDGRSAARKHGEAVGKRKSHQVDQNVNFATSNQCAEIHIAQVSHVNKILERRLYSAPQVRAVVRSERKRNRLKTRFLMSFEQA